MTRFVALVALACVAASGCNAIVGVTEVTRRPTSPERPDSADEDSDSGEDPPPSPVTPRPGDGTDAGTAVPPECNGRLDCERLVFVTRATFTGDLDGLQGADQKCFEAAKSIPGYAGRAFRAWISDSTATAAARIPHGTKPFRRTDRSVLATSWADLVDGTLNLPANLDEKGALLEGGTFQTSVWSGTDPAALYNGSSCNDWLSSTVTSSGSFADSQATDVSWTEVPGEPIAVSSCNAEKHLYCVEY